MAVVINKSSSKKSAKTTTKGTGNPAKVKTTLLTSEQLYKADIEPNAVELEDEFKDLYVEVNADAGEAHQVLKPPYPPRKLRRLVQQNNMLGPCVDAMEVNIDGTGSEIVVNPKYTEEVNEDDPEYKAVRDFMDEPWPGVSMITLRRRLRRDQEEGGYAYAEMLRTPSDELVFMRRIDPTTIRKCRLGPPRPKKITVDRAGTPREVTVSVRPRVYSQSVGSSFLYFKEYGVQGDLDKYTGKWASTRIAYDRRASEILEYMVHEDVDTPYGVPRWINQTPSVVGSRKAEESNLDLFESGGIPPAIVFLLGGEATAEGEDQLNAVSKYGSKTRLGVVSLQSTEGGLADKGNVNVQVERFGSSQQNDSMYKEYDKSAAERIRMGFRLPPLFVGSADSYNYATAFASYMVAESQVFQPERTEFDEIMNNGPIREISQGKYRIRSNPITTKDITAQLKALQMVSDKKAIDNEELVDAVNRIAAINVKWNGEETPDAATIQNAINNALNTQGGNPPNQPAPQGATKAEENQELSWLSGLVDRTMQASGMIGPVDKVELEDIVRQLGHLDESERDQFNNLLTGAVAETLGEHPDSVMDACKCSFQALTQAA